MARDLDRDDWRTFRVDRMTEPALTGHRFPRTADPDVGAMVADGPAFAAHQWQADVWLPVDPPGGVGDSPQGRQLPARQV